MVAERFVCLKINWKICWRYQKWEYWHE